MRIICLLSLISTAMACLCRPQSAHEAFCNADSVSRVKVLFFHNPNNDNSEEIYSIYGIEHIEVYKKPFDLITLPPFILTPSNMLYCAVHLEVGREYLLSGRRGDGNKFYLFLCGHPTDEGVTGVAEWQNVSVELRSNLTTFYC